jgi:hypothetical protein
MGRTSPHNRRHDQAPIFYVAIKNTSSATCSDPSLDGGKSLVKTSSSTAEFGAQCKVANCEGMGRQYDTEFVKYGNMNSPQQFQLIEGVFTAEDASRILGAMVKGKIDYHTLERHSHSERDQARQIRSEERLDELRELNARLKELLETAVADQRSLRISGIIEIVAAD